MKLTMIACVDRGSSLVLGVEDFNRAMGWMLEAEARMPLVFETGSITPDSRVMDEIVYYIKQRGGAVGEHAILNFARQRLPLYTVHTLLGVMQNSGVIKCVGVDPKTGLRKFTST